MRALLLLLAATLASAQGPTIERVDLFSGQQHDHPAALTVDESLVGNDYWQVFTSKETGKEAFRILTGRKNNDSFWSYGVVLESDLNRDGITDYSWYGGDETSQERLVVLSSPSGYRVYDLIESAARAYAKEHDGQKLNLKLVQEWSVDDAWMEPGPDPVLHVKVGAFPKGPRTQLRIPARDLVMTSAL